MGLLSINDLQIGMVIACEVANKHGNVLLKRGEILNERHIMLLKSWGITEADVEGFDRDQLVQKEMEELSPDTVASIEQELTALFPGLGDNPLMKELYRVVKKFKMKQASAQVHGIRKEAE